MSLRNMEVFDSICGSSDFGLQLIVDLHWQGSGWINQCVLGTSLLQLTLDGWSWNPSPPGTFKIVLNTGINHLSSSESLAIKSIIDYHWFKESLQLQCNCSSQTLIWSAELRDKQNLLHILASPSKFLQSIFHLQIHPPKCPRLDVKTHHISFFCKNSTVRAQIALDAMTLGQM